MASEFSDFDRIVERSGTDTYKWDVRPVNGSGTPILPMWVADMDFPCAPAIQDAMRRRIEHPVFGYTYASQAYRDAFLSWQERRNGWHVPADALLFAPAVMPAVRAAILTFTEPGDEVIIQPPVYFPFFDAIRDNGRAVVENPLVPEPAGTGVRYRMDVDQLGAVISPRTRMLILCSPHNPVGRVWTRLELEQLAEICLERDIIVVADEIHSDIRRSGIRFVPFASLGKEVAAQTVVCNSPSKTFNIAGLASSHVVVPDTERRRALSATLSRLGMTLPNLLALEASRAAYAEGEAWVDELLAYLDDQIDWFAAELARRFGRGADATVRLSPIEGTYLAWLDLRPTIARSGARHSDIEHALLESGALWLSEGRQFGSQGDGFFRMNLATPRRNVGEGLSRLERAIDSLERAS